MRGKYGKRLDINLEEAQQLLDSGLGITAVARQLQVPRQTLSNHLLRLQDEQRDIDPDQGQDAWADSPEIDVLPIAAEPDSAEQPESFWFYGSTLEVIRKADALYVSLRRLCEPLGLNYSSQLKKIKGQSWGNVVMITTLDAVGRRIEQAMLHYKCIPMWLSSVNANRVSPEVRQILVHYQFECVEALAERFLSNRAPSVPGSVERQLTELARISEENRLTLVNIEEQSRHNALAILGAHQEIASTRASLDLERKERQDLQSAVTGIIGTLAQSISTLETRLDTQPDNKGILARVHALEQAPSECHRVFLGYDPTNIRRLLVHVADWITSKRNDLAEQKLHKKLQELTRLGKEARASGNNSQVEQLLDEYRKCKDDWENRTPYPETWTSYHAMMTRALGVNASRKRDNARKSYDAAIAANVSPRPKAPSKTILDYYSTEQHEYLFHALMHDAVSLGYTLADGRQFEVIRAYFVNTASTKGLAN